MEVRLEKIAKAVSKNTSEDQKNPHNQQRSLRKYTYYQKNSRKLLMNFDYHNYKYVTTMEYQKIPHLDETNDQTSKVRTRKWVEVNDYTNNGAYSPGSDIKFNTTMMKLCASDYNDVYIFVKGTITMVGDGTGAAAQ